VRCRATAGATVTRLLCGRCTAVLFCPEVRKRNTRWRDGRAGERARNRAHIETHVMTQTRTQPGRSHLKAHRQGWMKLAHGPRASSSLTLQLDKEGCTHAVAASPSRPLPDRLCKALLCTQYFGTSPSRIHSSRCRDEACRKTPAELLAPVHSSVTQ
jgi:hypothetical protein